MASNQLQDDMIGLLEAVTNHFKKKLADGDIAPTELGHLIRFLQNNNVQLTFEMGQETSEYLKDLSMNPELIQELMDQMPN